MNNNDERYFDFNYLTQQYEFKASSSQSSIVMPPSRRYTLFFFSAVIQLNHLAFLAARSYVGFSIIRFACRLFIWRAFSSKGSFHLQIPYTQILPANLSIPNRSSCPQASYPLHKIAPIKVNFIALQSSNHSPRLSSFSNMHISYR